MKNFAIIFLLLIGICSKAYPQKKRKDKDTGPRIIKETSMVTGQENEWRIVGRDAVIVRDSSSNYTQIYIKSPKQVVYGNRCAEKAAQRRDVEFVAMPKDIGWGMTRWNIFFVNTGAHIKMFFKNGPFWKHRLRKEIQRCKDGTSDFSR